MNVCEFLCERHVDFDLLPHPTTYTAQHMAQALHVPGGHVAKTVVLDADGENVLAVLPATDNIDLPRMADILHCESLRLVRESELSALFPDCERGAVPPFGSQCSMRTLVDRALTHDVHIVFEGNSHDESISMRYDDFERIENPQVVDFVYHQ